MKLTREEVRERRFGKFVLPKKGHVNCIVAFIDILGFTSLVRHASQDERMLDAAYSIVRILSLEEERSRQFRVEAQKLDIEYDFNISVFSDCFALSLQDKGAKSALLFIKQLGHILQELIKQGYLMRGGVTSGKLYHNNNAIFGESLIQAVELEKDASRMPRIIVSKEVFAKFSLAIESSVSNELEKHYILSYGDGNEYLNYLYPYWDQGSLGMSDFLALRKKIIDELDNNKDSDIFQKWLWFANYFNKAISIDSSIELAYGSKIDLAEFI